MGIDPKEKLKGLIKRLHEGEDAETIKDEFKKIIAQIGPTEISKVEEQLIKEGLPAEEVRNLCDVHLEIFKEAVEVEGFEDLQPGHPIYILLREHEYVKRIAERLTSVIKKLESSPDYSSVESELKELDTLLGDLREYNKHKVREENCLFPVLEKHGITQPPKIMWTEHDEQRASIKEATEALNKKEETTYEKFKIDIIPHLNRIIRLISEHFYKEENILFKTSVDILSEDEFRQMKASMDDLGYCEFTPLKAIGDEVGLDEVAVKSEGKVNLPTGSFTVEELEAILNILPVDISFVDRDDRVQYFNLTEDRIFPRTTGVLGRTVQNCHPQKSLDIVNRIVNEFKEGKRDLAEFWINMEDRIIHIRYFPVRGDDGEYLGVLEVTQDITDIQTIEGEKRLLDN